MSKEKLPRNEKIGKRVKWSRIINGLTQKELADMIGINVITLSRIEGAKYGLSDNIAQRIGECLGILPDYLLGKTDYRTPEESANSLDTAEKKRLYAIKLLLESYGYTMQEIPEKNIYISKTVYKNNSSSPEHISGSNDKEYKMYHIEQHETYRPTNIDEFDMSNNGHHVSSGQIDGYSLEICTNSFLAMFELEYRRNRKKD